MKKTNLSSYLLIVGLATLVAVMVTIIQKSYSGLIGPVNEVKANPQIKSIDPRLDIDTLNAIEGKKEYFE